MDESVPSHIGNYAIEGLIDRGGMSLLYLGIHTKTGSPAIVKVLSPKYVPNQEVVTRFTNEATIIALADHPNIVKLYEYGTWENGFYIAIEFVKGKSLRKILSLQPFPLRKALEIILETAYALCHLHTHGIIHGDIKPENILITDDDKVKLIDFGIAKMFAPIDKLEEAFAGKIAGTPIYMSPEAKKGLEALTFQSDIYSLGIMAYELVLGRITHGKIILSLAPKGLGKILSKALQPVPSNRYQDIVDFITDISNYMNSAEVEKDRHGSDYFFELYEKLEEVHESFLPKSLPAWPNVDIGKADIHGMGLSSTLYYDFFDLKKNKVLFLASIPVRGGEGVISIASLRSICRTLFFISDDLSRKTLFELLKHRIQEDLPPKGGLTNASDVSFSLFFFDDAHYELFSYGKAPLLIQGKAPTCATQGAFLKGEPFYIAAFVDEPTFLTQAVESSPSKETSMQHEVESLLRKMRMLCLNKNEDQPFVLIGLKTF